MSALTIRAAAGALSLGLALAASGCTVPDQEGTAADRADTSGSASQDAAENTEFADETAGQTQARKSAAQYLDTSAFSLSGLVEQLEYEGFSKKDATYGVMAQKANFRKQAALSAKQYLDTGAFSRQGLIDQLKFEGYTDAQAAYGADEAGL